MSGVTMVVVKQKDGTYRGVFWDGDPMDGDFLEKIYRKTYKEIFYYGVEKYIDGEGRVLNQKKINF